VTPSEMEDRQTVCISFDHI